jgi:hypothetical protein
MNYLSKGELADAINCFTIAADGNHSEAAFQLGKIYLTERKLIYSNELAIKYLKLTNNPQAKKILQKMGQEPEVKPQSGRSFIYELEYQSLLPSLISSNFLDINSSLQSFDLMEALKSLYLVFPQETYSQLIQWAQNYHYKPVSASRINAITLDEATAIYLYTIEMKIREQSLYYVLNKALRNRDIVQIEHFKPYITILLRGLSKLPPYVGTVWRAFQNVDFTSLYKKGSVTVWNAFSSCTVELGVTQTFF